MPSLGTPGQTKVSGDRQRETTHEICCLAAEWQNLKWLLKRTICKCKNVDIFYHLESCHNRKNGFSAVQCMKERTYVSELPIFCKGDRKN